VKRCINLADRRQKNSSPPGISMSTSRDTGETNLQLRGASVLDRDHLGRFVMVSIIDWFLIWWLHSGRYRWSWVRRQLFERRYLTAALAEISSLEEIEACLRQVKWLNPWASLGNQFDSQCKYGRGQIGAV